MVAQAGQDMLIQMEISGEGEFRTIGGLRASKLSLNSQSIVGTNLTSEGRWRSLIEGVGIRTAAISGSGVFVDDETDTRIQQLFFNSTFPVLKFRIPDFGDLIGKFQIVSIEFSGKFDAEALYDLSFASAGEVTFQKHIQAL